MKYEIRVCGDRMLNVVFIEESAQIANSEARWLSRELEASSIRDRIETVVGVDTLAIAYDPFLCSYSSVRSVVERILRKNAKRKNFDPENEKRKIHELPVCYSGDFAPDIGKAANKLNITENELIARHCRADILVYSIDPADGLMLSEDGLLASDPQVRASVPVNGIVLEKGRTRIANREGEYDGYLIGRAVIGDGAVDPECAISAGDYIRFVPVTENRMKKLLSASRIRHEVKYIKSGSPSGNGEKKVKGGSGK